MTPAYYERVRQELEASKAYLAEELVKLDFTVFPSYANFMLARLPAGILNDQDGRKGVWSLLVEEGIYVRNKSVMYPDTDLCHDMLRITPGHEEGVRAVHRRPEKDIESVQVKAAMSTYQAVRESFIDYIDKNKYKIGDRLPSENELAKILRVSRVTFREAIRQLREDGFLYSRRGSGTYVSGNLKQIAGTLDENSGLTQDDHGSRLTGRVSAKYETELIHASPMARRQAQGEERLRDRTPETRQDGGRQADRVFPGSSESPGGNDISLAGRKNRVAVRNDRAERHHHRKQLRRAQSGELHQRAVLKSCRTRSGSPILVLKQVIVDQKGSPLFYGEDYFRPDCFVFSINRKRGET